MTGQQSANQAHVDITTTYTVHRVGPGVSTPPDLRATLNQDQTVLLVIAPDQDTSDEFICALTAQGWVVRETSVAPRPGGRSTGILVTESQSPQDTKHIRAS